MRAPATRVVAAVSLGLLLAAAALALVLAQRDTRLAGTNSLVEFSAAAVPVAPKRERCAPQDVPGEATSVRLYAGTYGRPGEPVAVTVRHRGRRVTGGRVPGGYADNAALTVPLDRETSRWIGARVCVRNLGSRPLRFAGNRSQIGDPNPEDDDVRTEWLLPGRPSWAGLAGKVADRFAITKPAFVGAWTLWAIAGVLAVLWALAIALLVARTRRLSARAMCAACAAIAFANAGLWALLTPPLQIPDEGAHFTYVQYIAERGTLPSDRPRSEDEESEPPATGSGASPELEAAAGAIPFSTEGRPAWFPESMRQFRRVEADLDRKPPARSLAAVTHPPLYYVLELAPYGATRSAGFFERLFVMRLFSCLLAALAVACVFLFAREVLPGRPWAAPVAALAAAFQPVFGFMAGGVNNDNLLVALAALLAYLVARVMRRGLTVRVGAALALVAVAGMLTKTTFAGLLPGAALGVLVGMWRLDPARRRRTLAIAAGGAAVFALGVGVWLVANQAVFERSGTTTTGGLTGSPHGTSLSGHLSYVWQAFLPRLPFMQEFKPTAHLYPLWDVYVQGFVGRFGWWRFDFPTWVNWLGLVVYVAIGGFAVAALARSRAALRARWPELVTYGVLAAGFAVLIEVAAYRYQAIEQVAFEQARYLLPLLPLYAGAVALAAVAAGRRWGPAAGAFLVVLAMTHSLFSMLLVVGHYYA